MCSAQKGELIFVQYLKIFFLLSKAFYQRGLTKMKLKHAKGIHDFNRALAINPTLFQVSRRWKDCLLLCLESFRFFTQVLNDF